MTSMEAHVKASLGEPTTVREISLDAQGVVSLLQIKDSPCDGATTIATAGLADLADRRLHEELVMACWSEGPVNDVASVVELLVRQLAEGRDPLRYGDVVGPAGPLVPGTSMDSIYVCEPTYYPSEFARFESNEGCEIHTRWLIPIHGSEAQVVADQGARVLEELLEKEDPDLLSLERDPVKDMGARPGDTVGVERERDE